MSNMDAILAQVEQIKTAQGDDLAKLTDSLSEQLKLLKTEKVGSDKSTFCNFGSASRGREAKEG